MQHASQIRVTEIKEDMPWVAIAMADLASLAVPAHEDEVRAKWQAGQALERLGAAESTADDEVTMGPRDPQDPSSLINDLEKLGVMTRRADGRIDVPDVYRVAFGLGRRGGIPKMLAG